MDPEVLRKFLALDVVEVMDGVVDWVLAEFGKGLTSRALNRLMTVRYREVP